MPFQSFIQSNLVIVHWSSFVLADVDALFALMRRASQQAGGQVHYIALIPQKVVPPEEVRGEIARRVPEFLQLCQAVHLVMEGSGFLISFKRSFVTGVILATKSRGRIFVYSTLSEALERIAPTDARLQHSVSSRAAAL